MSYCSVQEETVMHDYASFDKQAWLAVTGWPAAAGFDAVRDGVDYAGLLEWRLLSAVSRSLRVKHELFDNRIELELLEQLKAAGYRQLWIDEPGASNLYDEVQARCELLVARDTRKVVFAPIMTHQRELLEVLKASDDLIFIHNLPDPEFPAPSRIPAENPAWCKCLLKAVLAGIEKQGVHLLETDRELLAQDIVRSDRLLRLAQLQLTAIQPELLMIPTEDGWYPRYFLEAARAMGVPSLLMQHGLDCEPFIFDHSRCDYAALWGAEREARYVTPPKRCRITGNPHYDGVRADEIRYNDTGEYLLLALRPNYADKLHFPSRSPAVQQQLMAAVCDWMGRHSGARLVIKMHPSSLATPVLRQLEANGVADRCRVLVREGNLQELLAGARVVLTEDSTVGLDAMLAGKPVVFAHFMPSLPTLPMVEYNAALNGCGAERLTEALDAMSVGDHDAAAMADGQRRFIADFAGPLDGRSGQRTVEFLREALYG
jgi:hypothetical protein